jgi:hypothetical protein
MIITIIIIWLVRLDKTKKISPYWVLSIDKIYLLLYQSDYLIVTLVLIVKLFDIPSVDINN